MARTYDYSAADADVRKLLVKVTDAITDDSDVEYFIERADDYIDARLHKLYYVPFTTTPPILKTISSHLASYYVLKMLYVQARTADNDAWMTSFKEHAYGLLEDIESGIILLIDSNGARITRRNTRGIMSSTQEYDPTFDEGAPSLWQTDPKKL